MESNIVKKCGAHSQLIHNTKLIPHFLSTQYLPYLMAYKNPPQMTQFS